MAHRPEDIRNVALFGHSSSGKTALVDALALKTGISGRHGSTADGTSISDNEPEEKDRKQTLTSHVFGLPVGKIHLNLVDTPGNSFASESRSFGGGAASVGRSVVRFRSSSARTHSWPSVRT